MSSTQEKLQALRAQGFSPEQIGSWLETRKQALRANGFSAEQIAEWAGEEDPAYGQKLSAQMRGRMQAAFPGVADPAAVGQVKREQMPEFAQLVDAGLSSSTSGLLANLLGLKGVKPQALSKDADFLERAAYNTGVFVGDLPWFLAGGAAGGGPASPISAMAGAFAFNAGARRVLMEAYEKGRIRSASRAWEVITGASVDAAKGYGVGLATGGAGALAGHLGAPAVGKFAAELGTMVTAGAALEGRLPEPEEFLDAAVLLGGLKAVGAVSSRLRRTYEATGKRPAEILEDAKVDPSIREDLLSRNQIVPRAYRELEAAEAAKEPGAIETTEQAQTRALTVAAEQWQARQGQELGSGAQPPEVIPPEGAGPPAPPTPPSAVVPSRAGAGGPPRRPSLEESERRVGERISVGEETPVLESGLDLSLTDRLVTAYVDRLNPLKVVVDRMAAGEKLPVVEDAYKLQRLLAGVHAKGEHFLLHGPFRFKDLAKIENGEPMQEILRDIGPERLDRFRRYVVALRSIELEQGRHGRAEAREKKGLEPGVETGIPQPEAEVIVRGRHKEMDPFRIRMQDYVDFVTDYYRDSGMLSTKDAEIFRAMNRAYVPFHRVLEPPEVGEGPRVKNRPNTSQLLKELGGDEHRIVDPLESIIKNTYSLTTMAEKNRAATAFIELVERTGSFEYAERIDKPRTKKGQQERGKAYMRQEKEGELKPGYPELTEGQVRDLVQAVERGVMTKEQADLLDRFMGERLEAGQKNAKNELIIFRDGKRERWKVDPEIYEVFSRVPRNQMGPIERALRGFAGLLRAGTVLDPAYMGKNVARDQGEAVINSEFGYQLGSSAVQGAMEVFGKGEMFQEWKRSGAPMSSIVSPDRANLQLQIEEMMRDPSLQRSIRNSIRHPIEALRSLTEISDQVTRVGNHIAARRAGADIFEAGFSDREVTLDFMKMGAKTEMWSGITAFFNPGIQGNVKAFQMLKNPATRKKAVAIGVATITIPSIFNWWMQKDEEGYDEIPQLRKDTGYVFSTNASKPPVPGITFEAGGKTWWWIPRPPVFGVLFGAMPVRAMEWMDDKLKGKDRDAFHNVFDTVYQMATPSLSPTGALPVVQAYFNKDIFTSRAIIPQGREKFFPEYQDNPYTLEVTKAIGHLVAKIPGLKQSKLASPPIIEQAIRGWTGGLGMYVMQAANKLLGKAGIIPEQVQPDLTYADMPLIRSFAIRYPAASAESIQEFYERYDLSERVMTTVKGLGKEGDLENAELEARAHLGLLTNLTTVRKTLSEMSATARAIYKMPESEISASEKRVALDNLYMMMTHIAKQGNEVYKQQERNAAAAQAEDERRQKAGAPAMTLEELLNYAPAEGALR